MRVLVVVVNGRPESGKDTAIRFAIDYLRSCGLPAFTFSSIDPVKDLLACAPLGIDVAKKTPELRLLLSKIGEALESYNGLRTNECVRFILQRTLIKDIGDMVCFIQIREPVLIERLRKLVEPRGWYFSTLLVSRPYHTVEANNSSDLGVANYPYDAQVLNDNTKGHLYDAVANCVAGLLRKAEISIDEA